MAASVSGSKTCTIDAHPGLTASTLTTLMAIAPENLTVNQLYQLLDAIERFPAGTTRSNTLGTVFQ